MSSIPRVTRTTVFNRVENCSRGSGLKTSPTIILWCGAALFLSNRVKKVEKVMIPNPPN